MQKKTIIVRNIMICTTLLMLVTSTLSLPSVANRYDGTKDALVLPVMYHFKLPRVEKINIANILYDTVIMADTKLSGKTGEPSLPTRGAYLIIPPGQTVKDVTVTSSEKACLGSGFLIEPCAMPVPFSEIETAPSPTPDKEIYDSDTLFPAEIVTQVGTHRFRGYQILILNIHPVQYIPKSGELFYYADIEITVNLQSCDTDRALFRELEQDKDNVMTMVDNQEVACSYLDQTKGSSSDDYGLLLITTTALANGFSALKDRHDAEGLNTMVMTLEDILSTYAGIDAAEQIRNCIIDMYSAWGIEYVLLGGDHDIIPARMLWNYNEDVPSDLYYACLDGSYNSDGDDRWGEPTDGENGCDVDLLAEVYVGRAPVDDFSEVQHFVNKTLVYMNIGLNDSDLQDMLLVGQTISPGCWGGDYLDALIDGSTAGYYTTRGIPSDKYEIDTLYDRDWPVTQLWPKEVLITKINNNVHMLNNVGHANANINMKLSANDVLGLVNEQPCFMYSQGCYAGAFDTADCIAEYFTIKTNNAAFAGVWNSRFGLFGISQYYHREFIDAIFGEGIFSLGQANQDSKHDCLYLIEPNNYTNSERLCYYELNLFGDPAVLFTIPYKTGEKITVKKDNVTVYNRGVVDIGHLLQGQKSKTVVFYIQNTGNEPLHFTGEPTIHIQGPHASDYQITTFPPSTQLLPGQSVTCSIQFTPSLIGRRTTDIIIPNDDPYASPYTFTIYGRRWDEAYNKNTSTWYHTIQGAIDNASPGHVITVPDGEVYLTETIVITKGIVLQSAHGADFTIINGSATSHARCFLVNHEDALLKGFTITHGWMIGDDGGGVKLVNGTVDHCTIINNYAENGGGIFSADHGTVTGCFIEYNNAHFKGGGIYAIHHTSVENCLIRQNKAMNGGGIYTEAGGSKTIALTTVTENHVTSQSSGGGGIYTLSTTNCVIRNSIVYGNVNDALSVDDNYCGSMQFEYSCSLPLPPGIGNIVSDPQFYGSESPIFSPYSLKSTSPCLDTGDPSLTQLPPLSLYDLMGQQRVIHGHVDMGAYESQVNPDRIVVKYNGCCIAPFDSVHLGFSPYQTQTLFLFTIENPGDGPLHLIGDPLIDISGKHAQDYEVIQFPSTALLQPGASTSFTVRISPSCGGRRTAQILIQNDDTYLHSYAFTIHGQWVEALNSNTGVWHETIQEAIDAASPGQSISIYPGEYYPEETLHIDAALTLKGVQGAEMTIINGSNTHGCIMLTHHNALLKGVTLTYGNATDGGGLKILSGTVEKSTITNNTAIMFGGGISVSSNGEVHIQNCRIEFNEAMMHGGGIYVAGTGTTNIKNCYLEYNTAFQGGGLYSKAPVYIENCLIRQNTANRGAGIYVFTNNPSTISLSTITENRVFGQNAKGGGICSVSGPSAWKMVRDSIVYYNTNQDNGTTDNYYGTLQFRHTCVHPLPTGPGNIASPPHFFKYPPYPYSLKSTSPCINAGDPTGTTMPLWDLAGQPRLVGLFVDMGAYEFQKNSISWGNSTTHDVNPGQ